MGEGGGSRKADSEWSALEQGREVRHWHQAPEERSRLVRTSPAPAAGQRVCAGERPLPSGDFGVPPASQRCHLPPTAHSATKPRQKTALHQDALSTARLGNITEVLQHPFHQRMFGNVFPNKTISNSRIPYFQNMLCWRNCHEIVENVKLLTSQLFYSVVLYSYYCICNVLLYLRSIQTKSCDFGPI